MLAMLIVLMLLGLFTLMTVSLSSETALRVIAILLAIGCYAALEGFIRVKHFYRAGVDDALIWSAMLLLVGTIRYYHAVMPLETAMVLAGIVMIGISWVLIRYLRKPRHGFTYQPSDDPSMLDKLNAESLLIAQTMVPAPPVKPGIQFGKGTGSGGGASGDY